MSFANATEAKFACYLDQHDLPWEYEVEMAGVKPDFLVHSPLGDVVCEVHEFADPEHRRSGAIDPYGYIRSAIHEKRRQGRGAKGKLPYVLVLGRDGLGPGPLDDLNITGAMFGDRAIQWTIDKRTGSATDDPPRQVFGPGGRLQPQLNTRFSALLHPVSFNPLRSEMDEELHRRLAGRDRELGVVFKISGAVQREFSGGGIRGLVRRLRRRPLFDPESRTFRATTYHNPLAEIPLPSGVFAGPYDAQWGVAGDVYTPIAYGVWYRTLPD